MDPRQSDEDDKNNELLATKLFANEQQPAGIQSAVDGGGCGIGGDDEEPVDDISEDDEDDDEYDEYGNLVDDLYEEEEEAEDDDAESDNDIGSYQQHEDIDIVSTVTENNNKVASRDNLLLLQHDTATSDVAENYDNYCVDNDDGNVDDDDNDNDDNIAGDSNEDDNQFDNCHKNVLNHDLLCGEEMATAVLGCDRSSVSSDSGLGAETSVSETSGTSGTTTVAIKTCLKSKLSVSAESINSSHNVKSESYKKMRLNGGTASILNKAQSLSASASSSAELLRSQPLSSSSPTSSELPKRTCLKRARFSDDDESCFAPSAIVNQQQQQQRHSNNSAAKKQRNVHFISVTVYYFPRAQGFSCVPSRGGSTLGMTNKHFHSKQFTIDGHVAQQNRRRIRRHNKRTNANYSEADFENPASIPYYYLQPVPLKRRRKLLQLAGVKRIEKSESVSCHMIRESREVCGCSCKVYCDPDTCECSQAGVKCQVDRTGFPCGCVHDHCANSTGRIEFNPFRVKTHYIHAMMRLKLEANAQKQQEKQRQQSQQQQNQSWFSSNAASLSPKLSPATANHNQNHNHHNVQTSIDHDPFSDSPFETSGAHLDFYSAPDYFPMANFSEMPITSCPNDTFSFPCCSSYPTTTTNSSASSSPSSASSASTPSSPSPSQSSSSSTTPNRQQQQQPYLSSNRFPHNLSFYDFQHYPYSSTGCFETDLEHNQIIENGYQSLMLNQNSEIGLSTTGGVNVGVGVGVGSNCSSTCSEFLDPLATLAQISSDLNSKLNGGSISTGSSSSASSTGLIATAANNSNTTGNKDVLSLINQTAADLFDQENFGEIIKKSMVETVSA